MARHAYDSAGEQNERRRWEPSHPESTTSVDDTRRAPEGNGHQGRYQARWISKAQINNVRKAGGLGRAVLVDYRTGFVIVEPVGSDLGDGEILSPELADYELREVWCPTTKSNLVKARKLLGLDGAP